MEPTAQALKHKLSSTSTEALKLHKIESQKWGAHSNGLLTKRDKISHLNSTQYVYQRKIDTIAILESAKRQNFYFKQRDEKQTSKELKSEKIKKRKKKRAKSGQWRERTERRKRRRMQSPTAQVLNASTETERARERERESHLCKSVRKIFSVLQDCCNCVAVWERQSFKLFNFFSMYK